MSNNISSQMMTPPTHLPWSVTNRKELLDNPLRYLLANPKMFQCTICKEALNPKIKIIRKHFSECHRDRLDLPISYPKDTQSHLDNAIIEAAWEPYTNHQSESNKEIMDKWYCADCDYIFRKKCYWTKHATSPNNKCRESAGSTEKCYELNTGGFWRVPNHPQVDSTAQISFGDPNFNMPLVAHLNFDELKSRVMPLLQDTEDVGTWHKVMPTFLARSDRIEWATDALKRISSQASNPHRPLKMWFDIAENYFDKFPTILSVIPGNVKALVQSFEKNVGEDDRKSYGFKERLSYKDVNRYFRSLMTFLFIKRCELVMRYTAEFNKPGFTMELAFQKGFIPLFLFELCSDNMKKVGEINWMMQHAQLQMLFIKNNELKLHECGYAGQRLATILHTVRTAALGKVALMNHDGNLSKFQDEVSKIQQSLTVQMICPHISLLRTMYRAKPNTRNVLVDEHHNILVDTVTFSKTIWTRLIPKVYTVIVEELDKLFEGMLHCISVPFIKILSNTLHFYLQAMIIRNF